MAVLCSGRSDTDQDGRGGPNHFSQNGARPPAAALPPYANSRYTVNIYLQYILFMMIGRFLRVAVYTFFFDLLELQ